jgi:hypothetical protein
VNRREAERLTHQADTLRALGFTAEEAESLRRISMTLRRWHELECGDGSGCIERDEVSGIPQWRYASDTGKYCGRPIPDRETGAKKRLAAILGQRNGRPAIVADRLNAAPAGKLEAYIQGDPRGAALYILRPGDVPEGKDAGAYYSRGICVY